MSSELQDTMRPEFWDLPLDTLNRVEWEALCDGCGRCCLKKLEDEEGGQNPTIAWTRVICKYFDEATNRCGCYSDRTTQVPECIDVKVMDILATHWIPDTCAYKLRAENKSLYAWHPLIAGTTKLMEEEGISVQGKVVSEEYVHPEGYFEHIIRWVEST